jgi:hypothetical protein
MSTAARRIAASLLALGSALALLLFGCWATASDAQGALALLVLGPLSIVLAIGALLLGREAARSGARAGGLLAASAAGLLLSLQIAFFGCAFIPACRPFPHAVIGAVASAYESITGETPYARAQRP